MVRSGRFGRFLHLPHPRKNLHNASAGIATPTDGYAGKGMGQKMLLEPLSTLARPPSVSTSKDVREG